MRTFLIIAAFLALGGAAPARAQDVPAELHACDDEDEWPPFVYFQRDAGRKTAQIAGFSVDYLNRLVDDNGHTVKIELMAWKRCLALVAAGRLDLVLSATWNPERDKTYIYLPPYYSVTPVYVYDRSRPEPVLRLASDLGALHACGLAGYTYSEYNVPDSTIDVGTRTLERAVAKLKAGHCDVLLTDEEVVRGARMTFGKDLFPPDQFAFAHPAYVKLNPLHMMVGRALPYRDALVDFMTKAIAQMEKSGEGAKLIQRYIGPS